MGRNLSREGNVCLQAKLDANKALTPGLPLSAPTGAALPVAWDLQAFEGISLDFSPCLQSPGTISHPHPMHPGSAAVIKHGKSAALLCQK